MGGGSLRDWGLSGDGKVAIWVNRPVGRIKRDGGRLRRALSHSRPFWRSAELEFLADVRRFLETLEDGGRHLRSLLECGLRASDEALHPVVLMVMCLLMGREFAGFPGH